MVRHDRAKRAKKTMAFYRINYGVKPPYFVLMDPEFVVTSLEKKVFVKSAVPELLAGNSVLVVTRCVTASLRAGGEAQSGAALMAKRLQHEDCHHERPIDPHECIYSLLLTQGTREKKLCLASQDFEFRKRVRMLPGVPIMHIYNNMIILDPPSTASTKGAENKARTHRSLNPLEQELVKKAAPAPSQEETEEKKAIPQRILQTKRRAKGPNPLSMLKKGALKKKAQKAAKAANNQSTNAANNPAKNQKKDQQPAAGPQQAAQPSTENRSADESGQSDKRKRKRKRKHAGSKKAAGGDQAQDNPAESAGENGPAKKRRIEEEKTST